MTKYQITNTVDDLPIQMVQLNDVTIPAVPFIWYREQEAVCPIHAIFKIKSDNIKHLYLIDDFDIDFDYVYLIIQTNIYDSKNLYVCLHSLMYSHIAKSDSNSNLLVIDQAFNMNIKFDVWTILLGPDDTLDIVSGGLVKNNVATGDVFIHGCAFSPPGCLHFRVGNTVDKTVLFCNIVCDRLDINMGCVFVLFNDRGVNDVDRLIDEEIEKIRSWASL